MKTKIVLSAVLAVAVVLIVLRCTIPTQTSGNGSDIGNATVAGMLYLPDGKTPAAGVKVAIRPKKTLADTGSMLWLHKDTATVTTNANGRFAFDSTLDTGTYVIEAASGNNAVLIDSVVVKNITTTDTLPPDTLKPAGAIKGIIFLSEGGDPRKVFVLAFGIDRFANVNADGSFKFNGLAEAKYDLRLISSLDNYGVLDTVNIPVKSADTTNLDTVELPFIGIPTPKNVKISYDTMKQIVTLTWSKADTALVKGYNVYRRNVDSNTVLTRINVSPVVDTFYTDNSISKAATYEYVVTALDRQNNEGNKSLAISVVFKNLLQLATGNATFGPRMNHTGLVFDGKMWIIGGDDGSMSTVLNDVWSSIDGSNWTQVTDSASFPKRKYHASVVFDNKMWVIGGYDGSPKNDVWYSSDGINWALATDSANFSPRYFHGCVAFDNKIWVIGGESSSSNFFTDAWYSSDGITWSNATNSAGFSARTGARYVVFENKIWMIAGAFQSNQYNDVWNTTDGITWAQVTNSASFPGRYYHSLVANDSLLWIFGGLGTINGDFVDGLKDAWYSSNGIDWTPFNTPPEFTRKRNHVSLVFQSKIWIIGQAYGENRSDVWYLE